MYFFHNLIIGASSLSTKFLDSIRNYNSAFSFASMKANLDPKMKLPGPYFFKFCGQVYHYLYNSLKPKQDCTPKYNQLYIIDSEVANDIRMNHEANKDVCLKEVNFKFQIKLKLF